MELDLKKSEYVKLVNWPLSALKEQVYIWVNI